MYDYAGKSKEERVRDEDIKSYARSWSHVDENYGEKRKLFNRKGN